MNKKLLFPQPYARGVNPRTEKTEKFSYRDFRTKNYHVFLLIFFLLACFFPKNMQAQECPSIIPCYSPSYNMHETTCDITLTPEMVIIDFDDLDSDCRDDLRIAVYDANGDLIGQGNSVYVDGSHLGQISFEVFEDFIVPNNMLDPGESKCSSPITLVDGTPPVITDCDDATVFCYELDDVPLISAMDACGNSVVISLVTDTVPRPCPNDTLMVITNQWTVADAFDNVNNCTQEIVVLRIPFEEDDIEAPETVTLACNSVSPPDTTPAALGYPTIIVDNNGEPDTLELTPEFLSGFCSDIKVIYEDEPISSVSCPTVEKFRRTFEIIDCCNVNNFVEVYQFIQIIDTTPPLITCPPDDTVGTTSSTACTANFFFTPAVVSDECSTVDVQIITQDNGTLNSNGGILLNFEVGDHLITYKATDQCGNFETCTMNLTVEDKSPPQPICKAHTVITLNNFGIATVNASVFDGGSTDNCALGSFKARRMATPPMPFADQIDFDCNDVGDTVMVELKVIDAAGNENTCMVEVVVQDKTDPVIVCPGDKTIDCGTDTIPANTGMAVAIDNCPGVLVTYVDNGTIDPMCGTGSFVRTWTATDASGRIAICPQLITVLNLDPFSGQDDPTDPDTIIFPPDMTIDCSALAADPTLTEPSNTGEPEPIGDKAGCSMVLFGQYKVDAIIGGPGCNFQKIFRYWMVNDMCQEPLPNGNPNAPQQGVWYHTQIITINDDQVPQLLHPPSDTTYNTDPGMCNTKVTIPTIPLDSIVDCNPNITVTMTSELGSPNNYGPFNAAADEYKVVYTISDGCQSITHEINITVRDNEEPTPICLNLSIPLDSASQKIVVWDNDFISKLSDNCTDSMDLKVTIGLEGGTFPPTTNSITFDCDLVGDTTVVVYICDDSGNCTWCVAGITITEGAAICPPLLAQVASVAGIIDKENGEGIYEVEVMINNGSQMEMTDQVGYFNADSLQMHEDYTFTPGKNNDPRNGVTTFDLVKIQQHILHTELLDSPYKMIAADANGSETITTFDLVVIRNLILHNTDEFPNGIPSWRFVDAEYIFPDPTNPFSDPFPEEKIIQDLSGNMTDLDFVSIKVGDVNHSAIPALTGTTETHTRGDAGELIFTAKDEFYKKGETVIIPLQSQQLLGLEAWQFTLTFETQILEFLEVVEKENVHFGTTILQNGALTAVWTLAENELLDKKPTWFDIHFKAKEDLYLSDVMTINSDFTESMAYNAEGDVYDVRLQFSNETIQTEDDEQFILYQNIPNPFSAETMIGFHLPKTDNVQLIIFDLSGKVLKEVSGIFEKGFNRFIVKNEDLPSGGLLYYEIKTSEFSASKKMFLVK